MAKTEFYEKLSASGFPYRRWASPSWSNSY